MVVFLVHVRILVEMMSGEMIGMELMVLLMIENVLVMIVMVAVMIRAGDDCDGLGGACVQPSGCVGDKR